MRILPALLLALCLLFGSTAPEAAVLTTYPVFDVMAYPGAAGDGTTDNTAPFQHAFDAAAVAGGLVRIPCGVFKTTFQISATVPAGKSITVLGSGCTTWFASGANALSLIKGDPFSTVSVQDLTFTTDGTTFTAISVTLPSGLPPGGSSLVGDYFENISYQGDDLGGAHLHYWGNGAFLTATSNVNVIGGTCNGLASPSTGGNCYTIEGNFSGAFYAMHVNFTNITFSGCAVGIGYGDYVQGVTIDGAQMSGCGSGVYTEPSPSGTLGPLHVTNSRIESNICGICINSFNDFNDLMITNNVFTVGPSSKGLFISGTKYTVSGNQFNGTSTSASIGIEIPNSSTEGGIIDNNFFNNLASGIFVDQNVFANNVIHHNFFFGNTEDYSIGSGVSGVVIDDDQPRNFSAVPTCTPSILYSRFQIADSPTATFNANVTTGGGANPGFLLCNGTNYTFH